MNDISRKPDAYIRAHPFDPGNSDCETVLDQLFEVYQESYDCAPPEIKEGFKQPDAFLEGLPLDDNNTVFNLTFSLCTTYERKAFKDGLQNGVDIKTVSSILGHFSTGFTLDTYAHVTTAAQKEAALTMGNVLSTQL